MSVNQPKEYSIQKGIWAKHMNRKFTEEATQKIIQFMKITPQLTSKRRKAI